MKLGPNCELEANIPGMTSQQQLEITTSTTKPTDIVSSSRTTTSTTPSTTTTFSTSTSTKNSVQTKQSVSLTTILSNKSIFLKIQKYYFQNLKYIDCQFMSIECKLSCGLCKDYSMNKTTLKLKTTTQIDLSIYENICKDDFAHCPVFAKRGDCKIYFELFLCI